MLPQIYEQHLNETNIKTIAELTKDTAEATEGTYEICEDGRSREDGYFTGTQYIKFWKHRIDKNRVSGGREPRKIRENREQKPHTKNMNKYWLKSKGKQGTSTDQKLHKEREHKAGNPTEMKRKRNDNSEELKHKAELPHLLDKYGRWEIGKITTNKKNSMSIANRPVVVITKIEGE